MSIVPVGKNRHQVNQGGFKHESMLDTESFENIFKQALAPGTVVDQVDQDVEVPGDLQSAMDQGGLDTNRGMPEGADGVGKGRMNNINNRMQGLESAPDEWKFDPTTGEPLAGLSGEEAYKKAYEMFAQMNLSVEVRGDLHGANWQVIVTPAKGRAVSKN